MQKTKCIVPGCNKPIRKGNSPSGNSPYCGMHYHRLYRYGTLELTRKREEKLVHSQGYIMLYCPDHILCRNLKLNYDFEHRIVFYNAFGQGPFKCHWCNKVITWSSMHIDHVDENKKNNIPSNLVASCSLCNTRRNGKYKENQVKATGKFFTFNNKTMHLSGWARELGVSHSALEWRINNWGLEKALSKPRRKKRK